MDIIERLTRANVRVEKKKKAYDRELDARDDLIRTALTTMSERAVAKSVGLSRTQVYRAKDGRVRVTDDE